MTTTRELLQQALEFLTHCDEPMPQPLYDAMKSQTITAIREHLATTVATARPEPEPVAWNRGIRDSVDSLLAQAGYADDSSARYQLACMNFDFVPQSQQDKRIEELEKRNRSLQHDLTITRDERDQANAHWKQLATWVEEHKNEPR